MDIEKNKNDLKEVYAYSDDLSKQILSDETKERASEITDRELADIATNVVSQNYPNPVYTDDPPKAFSLLCSLLTFTINSVVGALNFIRDREGRTTVKLSPIKCLTIDIVCTLIFAYYHVVNFASSADTVTQGIIMGLSKDEENDPQGTFELLEPIIAEFAEGCLSKGKWSFKELIASFTRDARTEKYIIADLGTEKMKLLSEAVPCKNGIFIREIYEKEERLLGYREAYHTHGLCIPFSFEANYKGKNNQPPVMPDGWSPDEWILETYCTDKIKEEQFWGIYRAILYPYDQRYKTAFIYKDNGSGNTGKSTLTELQASTVGINHCANLSLDDMSGTGSQSDFKLEALANPSICLILENENAVKSYRKDLSRFKKLTTQDATQINRKYKPIVSIVFHGRIIQVVNDDLRQKDNSESIFRRLHYMYFSHHVGTSGVTENKNIKNVYIHDQRVIDWCATEAINRNIVDIPKSAENEAISHDSRRQNDPVLRYMEDWLPDMVQNWFTPSNVYPSFVEFCKSEGAQVPSLRSFSSKLTELIADGGENVEWTYAPRKDYKAKPENISIKKYNMPLDNVAGDIVMHNEKSNGIYSTYSRKEEVPYVERINLYDPVLKDDPIFDSLTSLTCTTKLHKRDAITAIRSLYHDDSCNKSIRAYFRKPDAEKQNLIDVGYKLLGIPYSLRESFSSSDVRGALERGQIYSSETKEFVDFPDWSNDPLWVHVVNRFKELDV